MRTPINPLLEISIPVGSEFMLTDQANTALVQETLGRAGLPPHAMVVEGAAALALHGLRPWHPDEKGQPGPVQVLAEQGAAIRLHQKQHPFWSILGLPKKFNAGAEPHALVVKPQLEPQHSVAGFGRESLFDYHVRLLARPGENGWLALDPATSAQMLLRDDPRATTIVRILRTHLDAHISQQPIISDKHWQNAVSKAARMAYDNRQLRQLPENSATALLLRYRLHNHSAFSFTPRPIGTKNGRTVFHYEAPSPDA